MALYNCPNCGVPITLQNVCKCCGAVINWIPTLNTIFPVKRYDKQILKAMATLDNYVLEDIPQIEERIVKELSYKMAESIPEIWTLEIEDDYKQHLRKYTAELPVWKEIIYG